MNILVLTPSFPSPTCGAGTRNYYLLKALARKHTVSLLTIVNTDEMAMYHNSSLLAGIVHEMHMIVRPVSKHKRMHQLLNVVRGSSYTTQVNSIPAIQAALDALFARNSYDVVIFESVLVAGYRVPEGVKVIIDQHNIEHELLQRTYQREKAWLRKYYSWRESCLLKPIEIERCRNAHLVLVTSERELCVLKSMLPNSGIRVVPNGVDTTAFQGNNSEQEAANRIVFTGTMRYYPNTDAVLFFAEHCWPLIQSQVPNVTWQIVGSDPPPKVRRLEEIPGVTVTGSVPDVRPYLATSKVAIAPLLIGSGTRLKILEALAMQKAVVSTNLGCEGLAVASGKHLIAVDQPQAFAQAVIELMNNPQLRDRLGSAGRALVEAKYSWERCGDQLLRALEEIC